MYIIYKKVFTDSCRQACAIELEEMVVISGGVYIQDERTVSVYTIEGRQRDLPKLNKGRWHHGCGHYQNSDNEMVSLV